MIIDTFARCYHGTSDLMVKGSGNSAGIALSKQYAFIWLTRKLGLFWRTKINLVVPASAYSPPSRVRGCLGISLSRSGTAMSAGGSTFFLGPWRSSAQELSHLPSALFSCGLQSHLTVGGPHQLSVPFLPPLPLITWIWVCFVPDVP